MKLRFFASMQHLFSAANNAPTAVELHCLTIYKLHSGRTASKRTGRVRPIAGCTGADWCPLPPLDWASHAKRALGLGWTKRERVCARETERASEQGRLIGEAVNAASDESNLYKNTVTPANETSFSSHLWIAGTVEESEMFSALRPLKRFLWCTKMKVRSACFTLQFQTDTVESVFAEQCKTTDVVLSVIMKGNAFALCLTGHIVSICFFAFELNVRRMMGDFYFYTMFRPPCFSQNGKLC